MGKKQIRAFQIRAPHLHSPLHSFACLHSSSSTSNDTIATDVTPPISQVKRPGKTGESPNLYASSCANGNPSACSIDEATWRLLTTCVMFAAFKLGLYAMSGTFRSWGRKPPWSSNSKPSFHSVPTLAPITKSGTLESRVGDPYPAAVTSSAASTYEMPRLELASSLLFAFWASELFSSHSYECIN